MIMMPTLPTKRTAIRKKTNRSIRAPIPKKQAQSQGDVEKDDDKRRQVHPPPRLGKAGIDNEHVLHPDRRDIGKTQGKTL